MDDFLARKTKETGKRASQEDLTDWLRNPELSFGPVSLRSEPGALPTDSRFEVDGFLRAQWQGKSCRFVFEFKSLSTPKSLEAAISQVQRISAATGVAPLIIVPFLSEERLLDLERLGISGLDLSGNGVLVSPEFSAFRSGKPSQFSEATTLRNPYAGDSSIFARCFLLKSSFFALSELQEFAEANTKFNPQRKENALQLGTASKVVQALAEELIVTKDKEGLRLTDMRRLMENLKRSYRVLTMRPRVIGKTNLERPEVWRRLRALERKGGIRSCATGIASASYHGVLFGVEPLSLYVDEVEQVCECLEIKAGRAFANIELIEDRKNLMFFDNCMDGDAIWASKIQTWLELTQAGPRESEAAEALARRLGDPMGFKD